MPAQGLDPRLLRPTVQRLCQDVRREAPCPCPVGLVYRPEQEAPAPLSLSSPPVRPSPPRQRCPSHSSVSRGPASSTRESSSTARQVLQPTSIRPQIVLNVHPTPPTHTRTRCSFNPSRAFPPTPPPPSPTLKLPARADTRLDSRLKVRYIRHSVSYMIYRTSLCIRTRQVTDVP